MTVGQSLVSSRLRTVEDHCCHTDCSFPEQTTPVRRGGRCSERGGEEGEGWGKQDRSKALRKWQKTFMDARSVMTNSPQVLWYDTLKGWSGTSGADEDQGNLRGRTVATN